MKKIKLKIEFPEHISDTLLFIVKKFEENGFECYLIGGSVRDLVLGNEIYDYDFATNARPEQVIKLFKRVIPTGIKHGTVSVLKGRNMFEITTYRTDGQYFDGRRPSSITYSNSLEEDVKRRDFTINGLAYDILNNEIIDHVQGLEDLDRKIIRTIGSPADRFGEDGLRSYRACRFASKLGFKIEDETFDMISQTLHISKKVSIERIRDEFIKILETEKPSVGIELLRKSGLLEQFLPELSETFEVTQNKYHVYDVYYHSVYSCNAAPRNRPMLRLTALLHDIGKVATRREGDDGDYTFYNHEVVGARMVRRIMKRLKFSNEDTAQVNNLVLNHMFHYTDEWTDGAVRRFMRKVGIENLDDLLTLREADRVGNGSRSGLPAPIMVLQKKIEKVIEAENAITVRDLNINGNILMKEFSLEPGPVIGRILNELLELVLDDPDMNSSEILLSKAEEIVKGLDEADLKKPEK